MNRSAWIDRGDKTILQERLMHNNILASCKTALHKCRNDSQSSVCSESSHSDHIRRSYTTEELKRERRRLPKRPDVLSCLNDLSPSISLHEQLMYNSPEVRRQNNNPVQAGKSVYHPMPSSTKHKTSL
ncbi:hypothetical protein KIN20_033585 [Parelaphostrongylus tenuis]|uniref:Uncharacterized protein n=1 Tax=Parelaphostrongylus tenuis TaxID=148309 RepID=A0AAD5WIJ6_PARTN|nr:hypothetical protein KIN20_033585 [Parelaphostrongylus tenuis]